jgi:hypothetical protein
MVVPVDSLDRTSASMRHVKIRSAQDIRPVLAKWLAAAAEINARR